MVKKYIMVKYRHTVTAKGFFSGLVVCVPLAVTCMKKSPSSGSLLSG